MIFKISFDVGLVLNLVKKNSILLIQTIKILRMQF